MHTVRQLIHFTIPALMVLSLGVQLAPKAHAAVAQEIRDQLAPIEQVYGGQDVTEQTFGETVARVIRIVLGLLGIIFLALIVYAGFMWMTAAGNEDRVKTAKQIMIAAIIGVAIVLAAYIITFFVFSSLIRATGIDQDGLGR